MDEKVTTPRGATVRAIDVPGARITYEVLGAGPVLALVGQSIGADGFRALGERLATDHTVVLHDPRGTGRSALTDPDEAAEPDLLAEDLAEVLRAVGGAPADVFGAGGGAVTALSLALTHPELVHTTVAHEPPLVWWLDDGPNAARQVQGVVQAHRDHGLDAGLAAFAQFTGFTSPRRDRPLPGSPVTDVRTTERLVLSALEPICLYRPDLGALRGSPRLVVGVGTTSTGELAHRCGRALARALGTEPAVFPGHHGGFGGKEVGGEAEAFAARLREVLARAEQGT